MQIKTAVSHVSINYFFSQWQLLPSIKILTFPSESSCIYMNQVLVLNWSQIFPVKMDLQLKYYLNHRQNYHLQGNNLALWWSIWLLYPWHRVDFRLLLLRSMDSKKRRPVPSLFRLLLPVETPEMLEETNTPHVLWRLIEVSVTTTRLFGFRALCCAFKLTDWIFSGFSGAYYLRHICLSVCLSASIKQLKSHWTDFD